MNQWRRRIRENAAAMTGLKLLLIGFLLLVFLIPLQMIRALIDERTRTRAEAEEEVIGSWGGDQVLLGPMIAVPFLAHRKDADGKIEAYTERAYFLPEALSIAASVNTQTRNRGIYEVTLYSGQLRVEGVFRAPALSGWRIAASDILWEEAGLIVELPDMRGLQQRVRLRWRDQEIPFAAGRGELGYYGGQIRAPLTGLGRESPGTEIPFSFTLHLQGGRSLGFLPVGEENTVTLRSPWPSPSFEGAFLPAERTLGPEGFQARWQVLSLGRAYPQAWRQGEVELDALLASRFGVRLMIPVDAYAKSLRSVKYGILFVLLPFLIFFLFETFSGRQVHPLQYLLVGLAVCLFFLLLLAVSEHLGFALTYLLASLATTALISVYSSAILVSWGRGWIMGPVLAAGYLFLYAALQSEDYALLIGSLGLLSILGAVMLLTRRVNWYGLGSRAALDRTPNAAPADTTPPTGRRTERR
jgi:inner membrane protein